MQRAGIFSINVWDFLAFMRIIFNSDHWIRKQQQQSRWNDKLPVSAVLWRLFTSQPPQNVADLIMFAGCLIAISHDITPDWPSIVLTPPPRRPQGDNHRVLLQLTIVNTSDNWCVMMTASSLTVIKARHKDLEWRGDTGKLGSQQSRRQEFLCFNSPVNCTDGRDFLISTDARLLLTH